MDAGRIERAAPGPWRDALVAFERARSDHQDLWRRAKGDHETYYDTPEPMRASPGPEVAASVAAIEESLVRQVGARDALWPARDAAIAAEAARLGREPPVPGEAGWARLMRDLEALRAWRVERCDGVDVHLPPLLWRNPSRERKSLFETALRAWGRASGIAPQAVRERVMELAKAGLLPGAMSMPGSPSDAIPGGVPFAYVDEEAQERAFGALSAREGADALAAEVVAGHDGLPPERFPFPAEALARLGHAPGLAP